MLGDGRRGRDHRAHLCLFRVVIRATYRPLPTSDEFLDVFGRERRRLLSNDKRLRQFSRLFVRNSNDSDVCHLRMSQDQRLQFRWCHLQTTTDSQTTTTKNGAR